MAHGGICARLNKLVIWLTLLIPRPCYCGSIYVSGWMCDIICETKTNQLSLVTWAFFV
jgi:hypothetical protein